MGHSFKNQIRPDFIRILPTSFPRFCLKFIQICLWENLFWSIATKRCVWYQNNAANNWRNILIKQESTVVAASWRFSSSSGTWILIFFQMPHEREASSVGMTTTRSIQNATKTKYKCSENQTKESKTESKRKSLSYSEEGPAQILRGSVMFLLSQSA